jgi:hypothetical protein
MDDLLVLREFGRNTPLLQAAELTPARDRLVSAMISDRSSNARPVRRSRPARSIVLASLATAGIAAAVAALLVVAPIDKPSGKATQPSAAAGSPEAPDSTFRLVADNSDSAQATARQLSETLDNALKKEAPGARWIFELDYVGQSPGPGGVPPQLHANGLDGTKKSEEMFTGGSGVLQDGRKGNLFLTIFALTPVGGTNTASGSPRCAPSASPKCAQSGAADPRGAVNREKLFLNCPRGAADCVEGKTPNGGKTVLQTISLPPLRGSAVPYREHLVRVQLADGRVLSLSHSNDFGPDMTPAAQRDTPLTREQVTAIAFYIASKIKA